MHLDEETLQRLLHDELEQMQERSARRHLSECDACRTRLAEALQEEKETHALLHLADHPAPSVSAEDVAARASAASTWGMRRAASIVAGLAIAGAVYAAPGSPLPKWVNALKDWIQNRPAENAPLPHSESSDSGTSGISVSPGDSLVIAFTSWQREGVVSVNLTDARDVVVRGPAHSATFTSGTDQLTVHNMNSSASFEVEIPHDAQRIEIRVEDRTILVKNGADIRAEKSAQGSLTLSLSRAPISADATEPRP